MSQDRERHELVLGIDIGSSGVRIAALDSQDHLAGYASAAFPPSQAEAGAIVQDPAIWWQATRTALADLGRQVDLRRVEALAVDGTSGTILAIDATGKVLAPARMYNDASAAGSAEMIARLAPPESGAHGATSALGRALLLQHVPGTSKIVHQADWIAGQFSQSFDTTDENNALKTGYDPVRRHWPDWLAAAGMEMDLLPKVIAAGAPMATIPQAWAGELGFAEDVLVVAGTTDGCAAFLATGAAEIGDAVTSLGTTMVLKLMADAPIFAPSYGIYSHRVGDVWLAGGASNSGGAALARHFSIEEILALEPQLVPDEPTGLDYYPLPGKGERFPINDPHLTARTEPRPAQDAMFLQGLLEGIAAIEKRGFDLLGCLGGPKLTTVRTVGGGARNAAWTKIRARILGVPLIEPRHEEAACGAARLARAGLATRRGR